MHSCTLNFKLLLRFIIVFISLAAVNTVSLSQMQQGDLNSIDFTKIKVDEISDEQIRVMMEKAAENGVTQQQIEMVALSRGMSQVEVQKLRLRMNTVQMLGGTRIGQQGAATGLMREDVTSQKRTDLKPEDILTEDKEIISFPLDIKTESVKTIPVADLFVK